MRRTNKHDLASLDTSNLDLTSVPDLDIFGLLFTFNLFGCRSCLSLRLDLWVESTHPVTFLERTNGV